MSADSIEGSTQFPKIVSWGEILWDRFPEGALLGGAPANVAFHLAAIGANVSLVSRVGDEPDGVLATKALASAGVDVGRVQVDSERQTGEVGVSIEPSGDAQYTLYPGRAWEVIECGKPERELLRAARCFCYGTLAQRVPAGHEAHQKALAELPEGAIALCDANLRSGFSDWRLLGDSLLAAHAVKLNEAEVEVAERELTDGRTAVEWLFEAGVAKWVALTLGANGCEIYTPTDRVSQAGFASRPGGDNVGCGDAFVAVFAHGLTSGWPLARIAETANRYAAEVASHRGATPQISWPLP